jgi:hypothetical protein
MLGQARAVQHGIDAIAPPVARGFEGSDMASRMGMGCQPGAAASMAATKPGISASARGVALRASVRISSPSTQQRLVKSSISAGGAKRLHSMEKPRRAMRIENSRKKKAGGRKSPGPPSFFCQLKKGVTQN